MIERATTRCCGVILAIGLQLPAPNVPPPQPGEIVPPATSAPAVATPPPAAPEPFVLAWTSPITATSGLGLAVSSAHIMTVSADGESPAVLEARSLDAGTLAWSNPTPGWLGVVASDQTVFGILNNRLHALEASSGRPTWTTDVAGTHPQISVVGGWLAVVTSQEVRVHGAEEGAFAWRQPLDAPAAAAAVIDAAAVTIALEDASILSFDLASGKERWRVAAGSRALGLATGTTHVYAGLANGTFCAYRASNGHLAWCQRLRVPLAGSPLVQPGTVHVALRDNTLVALDRGSGAMLRRDELGHRPASGPELSAALLAVALATGDFVLFDAEGRRVARVAPPSTSLSLQVQRTLVDGRGRLLASLTIPPGGRLMLTVYRPPTVPATAPPKTDDTASGTPTGSPP